MIKKVDKMWGYEEWAVNTQLYCGKFLYLIKGKRSSMHYHKNKDETFYILKGKVLIEIDGENRIMEKRDIRRITPLTKHRFSGLEDSIIVEFSTHHEDDDSYRIEQSGDIPNKIMEKYK